MARLQMTWVTTNTFNFIVAAMVLAVTSMSFSLSRAKSMLHFFRVYSIIAPSLARETRPFYYGEDGRNSTEFSTSRVVYIDRSRPARTIRIGSIISRLPRLTLRRLVSNVSG